MNRKARFACNACRELPSCTLCIRLEKKCEYPPRALGSHHHRRSAPDDPTAIDLDNRRSGSSSNSSSGMLAADPRLSSPAPETQQPQLRTCENFPVMYFLDSETCVKPLSPTEALYPTAASAQPTPEAQAVFEAYFSSVHTWLPILSKKRIQRILVDASAAADNSSIHSLLFQYMRLLASPAPASGASTATPYQVARESLMRAEAAHLPSLALLQSAILLTVYEIAHGVYPAAYLRVGHAAQLFRETRTWNGREEERRAWWAVFCLDRFVNQGVEGLAPCTPEPSPGELLPAHETAWDAGAVGFNEPLFASSFSASTSLGAFANTCQAALILGRVLSHRDEALAGGGLAPGFRMSEARQLHAIPVSLSTHLNCGGEVLGAEGTWVSLAMCSSARLILYNMYACNERYSAEHERSTEEAEMQKLTLSGIIEVARATGQFARQVLDLTSAAVVGGGYGEDSSYRSGIIPSPLVAHLLYSAATECEWFILEQQDSDAAVSLKEIVELLRVMAGRWQVAGIYLSQIYKWPGYNSMLS
ncbi:hypothetical protein F4809DRAFT_656731 [Biscogniauxia mediterranea]|nr:hypothetical protein F4809DRAFT_656731 [Biscogniauxia mediterranea]